jgi:histone deacetylase complex regulatory component SIN3
MVLDADRYCGRWALSLGLLSVRSLIFRCTSSSRLIDIHVTAPAPESTIQPPSPEPSGTYDGRAIEPAVQYVQKIKNRCDPETYRQFLDILSRYHHKPETIDEV